MREHVERDHERRLDDAASGVPPGAGAGPSFGLENVRLPEQAGRLPARRAFSPGCSRQNSTTSSRKSRICAHSSTSTIRPGSRVDRAGVLRARRRAGKRRHVVDPAAAGEHVVRVQVVRLPERSRVGRDREAADRDVVAYDPRRENERGARADDEQRGQAVVREPEAHHAARRRARAAAARAARCRGSRARATAPSAAAHHERAALRRPRAIATRTIAAARSWSRISRFRWMSCQTRYGCSVASRAPPSADAVRRDASCRSRRRSSAVATATAMCAIADASPTTDRPSRSG